MSVTVTSGETTSDDIQKYYDAIATNVDGEAEEGGGRYYESERPIGYRTEDFISRPYLSQKCDIEDNILEFDYSYGYDCKKPYNLIMIDEQTIIFASGNFLHFFDVNTMDLWVRRSAGGGGIGHITNNSTYPHFAVGENGNNPLIIVYEWPSLEIVCVLKGGSRNTYTHLNYSPSGDLLVSQGGEPEYLITIWNWMKSSIVLRTRSYNNDVYRVMFSNYLPGHITSAGVAHIKFWKIVKTFTGLKLKGELGRFGKTEYSDIVGIYQMADEKVISGCHWGNILVWEEGLIKFEVCRKNRKRCHDGAIVQFNYHHGELWTVSLDGHVRMWFYDTIDQADPPDDDRFVQMEPTYDFHTPGARFMCIAKQYLDPEDTFYVAQDAMGAIWRIDLNIEEEARPSERLLKSHAGITKGLAACPWGPYFSTIGIGGWVHLYNYNTRDLLMILLFPAPGNGIMWMPMKFDPSGETVILVFGDGTVRVGVYKINAENEKHSRIHIIQILKPHSTTITCMTLNTTGKLLVTGSEDKTIFIFQVFYEHFRYLKLIPIGFMPMQDVPTCFTWHNNQPETLIIGCLHGLINIIELPTSPLPYTNISYKLAIMPISQKFHTYKSQIFRNRLLEEIRKEKAKKLEKKIEKLKKLKSDNPGLDIDEEMFLADSEDEEELPPLVIPEVPNKIFWIIHTCDDTLWVSMAGYDAGFIYEYRLGQSDPIPYKCVEVEGAENLSIANYVYSPYSKYLVFAMIDGSVRVNRVNPDDWHDLSNYWTLNMHDNYNGYIPGFSFSYDNDYLLTSGNDGNIFAMKYNGEEMSEPITIPERIIPRLEVYTLYDNVKCSNWKTLEETLVHQEEERKMQLAREHMDAYLGVVLKLRERFEAIQTENETLPDSQKLTLEELTVDQRVFDDLNHKLNEELTLTARKLEFSVEKSRIQMEKLRNHFLNTLDAYPIIVSAVNLPIKCRTLKQHILGDDYDSLLKIVDQKIKESTLRGRAPERTGNILAKATTPPPYEHKLEYFLAGLPAEVIENQLGPIITRLLKKYRARKMWKENRKREWEIFNALAPSKLKNDEDEQVIKQTEETIGDYKLKSAPNYKTPIHLRETTFTKYKDILLLYKKQFDIAHGINQQIFTLRDKKKRLYEKLMEQCSKLKVVQSELKEDDRKESPKIFSFGEVDYPEKRFEIKVNSKETSKEPEESLTSRTADMLERQALTEFNMPEENDGITEWETHMRSVRYQQKLLEQNVIIQNIEKLIANFDQMTEFTFQNYVGAKMELNTIQLHLYTLVQELIVLKECEQKEDLLSDKVNAKLQEVLDLQDEIADISSSVEANKKELDRLAEKEKEITKSFFSLVSDNKFYDFLRRIFKKKYKVPKVHTDEDTDSESSSSSSDESEEEDVASVDSKDFNIIRLDESECPKGCDNAIYDLTFQMRGQRHEIEQKIKDITMENEALTKKKDAVLKRLKTVESDYKYRQDELDIFQREKQKHLNQIMAVVVLKLSQIKNLKPEGGGNLIAHSLVFSQSNLTKLYKRVGILDREKHDQKNKYMLSVVHLKRMQHDIEFMEMTISNLKKTIVSAKREKFGSLVDLNDLEEYMLKRLILDLRLSVSDIKGMFDVTISQLYEKYKYYQKAILRILRQNTIAQDLLSLLKVEHFDLKREREYQEKIIENIQKFYDTTKTVKKELSKLETILKGQTEEIEALNKEIKLYKTKGFSAPKPICLETETQGDEVYEEQSFVSEWEEIEDYRYTEPYAKEYWAHREVEEARKTRREVINSIIDELFKNMKIQLERNMIVSLLKSIISGVMNKCDVKEIIDWILKAIPEPDELTDEQNSMIEYTAERLCTIEEFSDDLKEEMVMEEESELFAKLDEVITRIVSENHGNPIAFIDQLLNEILDNIPLHVAMTDVFMANMIQKVFQTMPEVKELTTADLSRIEMKTVETNILLEEFVDRLFKTSVLPIIVSVESEHGE